MKSGISTSFYLTAVKAHSFKFHEDAYVVRIKKFGLDNNSDNQKAVNDDERNGSTFGAITFYF